MTKCPNCQSDRLRRSRSRNTWERWRKQITGKVAYRCADCGWRGWGVFRGTVVIPVAMVPDPPNLDDSPLARTERGDLGLEELDRIG